MTDPQAIADGLSEAQRRWLDEAWYGSKGWRIVGFRKKACDLGICHPNTSLISPLGLSVRAILAKEEK